MSQQEEQKINDGVANVEHQDETKERLDLSFIHLSKDLDKREIILEPVQKTKKEALKEGEQANKQYEPKCKLFKINKGKQLIYQAIQDIHNHNKDRHKEEIRLHAKTTASYMLIQVLADLQYNKIITIKQTKDASTEKTYDLIVSIIHHPIEESVQTN